MNPIFHSLRNGRTYWKIRWNVRNLPDTPTGIYTSPEHKLFGALWRLKLDLKKTVEEGKTAEFVFCFGDSSGWIDLVGLYADFEIYMLKLEVRSTGSRPSLEARKGFMLMQWSDSILLRGQKLQDLMSMLDRYHVLEVTCYIMQLSEREVGHFRWIGKEVVDEGTQTPLTRKHTISSLESLSGDFSKLLLDEDSSRPDAKLKCGEHTLPAHRNVLSARSRVFARILQRDMTEDRAGLVEIQDMNRETLENFLRFLYTGKLPELTTDTARDFYEFGDKYQVESLMKYCSDYLIDNDKKIARETSS